MKDYNVELRKCILKGIAYLTFAVCVLVAYALYFIPHTKTREFQLVASSFGGFGIVLFLSLLFFKRSHNYQRFVHFVVAVSLTMGLIVSAHSVSDPNLVVNALATATLLTLIASSTGSNMKNAKYLGMPLFLGLLVLYGASMVNARVLNCGALEIFLSICFIVLFTAFSIYDAHVYANGKNCRHDCCEEGVFQLFVNFANLAHYLLKMLGHYSLKMIRSMIGLVEA